MSIDLSAGATIWLNYVIENFKKTLSIKLVTKSVDNTFGDETLIEATATTIYAPFFLKNNSYSLEQAGLFENADALAILKPSQTINKNDIIIYNNIDYRVDRVIKREMGGTSFYYAVFLFKVEDE